MGVEEQSQAIDHIKYIQNHIDVNPALIIILDLKVASGQKRIHTQLEVINHCKGAHKDCVDVLN